MSGDLLAIIVLGSIAAALLALFGAFFVYSRTPAWRSSELRMSTLRFLVIIGPFFGARVDPPPPERTAISTPGPDGTPALPLRSADDSGAEPDPQSRPR